MKNKIIGYLVLAIMFAFPLNFLLFNNDAPGFTWLFSMIAVMIGFVLSLYIFISKPFENKLITQPDFKTSINEIGNEMFTSAYPDFNSVPQGN